MKAIERTMTSARRGGVPRRGLRWGVGLAAALVGGVLRAGDSAAAVTPAGGDALDNFSRQLSEAQRARVAPILLAARTNAEARSTALLESLLALHRDLARAVGILNSGQPTNALPFLDRLAETKDPFLGTHVAWFRIQGLIGAERYEEAQAALAGVRTNAAQYTQMSDELLFTEGLLQALLLNRTAAEETLQRYLEQYPQAPPERRGGAQAVLDELARAKPESLPEVVTLMNESRRRLYFSDSGDRTQEHQRKIVEDLDKLIAKIEEQKKKGGGGGEGEGSGSGSGSQSGSGSGGSGGAGSGKGTGAKSSSAGGAPGMGPLDRPSDGGDPDAWAKAYKRERETVQRELQAKFPERYRELIEQYYRSLPAGGTAEGGNPK